MMAMALIVLGLLAIATTMATMAKMMELFASGDSYLSTLGGMLSLVFGAALCVMIMWGVFGVLQGVEDKPAERRTTIDGR